MNLDFQWNEQEENHHDKEFPPQGEENQSIYSTQTFQNMLQSGSTGENLTAHKPKSKKTKSVEKFSEYAKAGQKIGDGEIIQVQGGHIIRATGRKDRHSKVCTSKGPRDRRVRLAAHTAIQFYDVQDRLGYDRPSKAVDWLMKKAKDAIDKLDDFPNNEKEIRDEEHPEDSSSSARYGFELQRHLGGDDLNLSVMQTTQSAGIEEDYSMKSFFPLSSRTSSLMEMQSYPQNKISRIPIQSQDLGLSLHTTHQNLNHTSYGGGLLSNSMGFEQDYAKGEPWNNNNLVGENRVGSGFIFNSNTIIPPSQVFGSQAFSQREPLQSNNYSHDLLHSWSERVLPAAASMDQQSSLYNLYFGSSFQGPAPAQTHGGQQDHSHI